MNLVEQSMMKILLETVFITTASCGKDQDKNDDRSHGLNDDLAGWASTLTGITEHVQKSDHVTPSLMQEISE